MLPEPSFKHVYPNSARNPGDIVGEPYVEVRLSDGSIWQAQQSGGRLILIRKIYAEESSSKAGPTVTPTDSNENGAKESSSSPSDDSEVEESSGRTFSMREYGYGSPVPEKTATGYDSDGNPLFTFSEEEVRELTEDNAFRARLESVMLDNKYDRRLKGRTRGKLDMTRLYKVPTESRSVFTQKQARKNKAYNIVLLVDESGSMGIDNRAFLAAQSTITLAKAFEGLNLNLAIVGFNAIITIHKDFDQTVDLFDLFSTIATMNHSRGASENNDYDALREAYTLFDHAPEGQNLLFMLSDGQPASRENPVFINKHGAEYVPKWYDADPISPYDKDDTKVLQHMSRSYDRRVQSMGVGITQGGHQIPRHVVVKDPVELKRELLKQLRLSIRRG